MPQHPTLIKILKKRPVILDGAWGTEFQKRGLPPGQVPDPWNIEKPEIVEAVARSYVEAGSQIILTNTFGANRFVLGGFGMADKVAEINKRGAAISKKAAGGRALVFGSMGSSGKMIMMGDVTADELYEAFREQAMALKEGGADGIVAETMSDLEEMKIAVRAAKETGLPVVASMVYDSGEKLDRTMMGVTAEQHTAAAEEAGADVVGANCGKGIEPLIAVCRQFRQSTKLPLWIKPNAGLPQMIGGKTVFTMTPAQFAARIPAVLEAGADFIGGCCGTSPDFIKAIASNL